MAKADSSSSKKASSAPHADEPIDMSSAAIDFSVAGIQIMPGHSEETRRSLLGRAAGTIAAVATASLLPLKPAPALGGVTPDRNQLSRQIQRAIENYEAAEGYYIEMDDRASTDRSEERLEAKREAERMSEQRLRELEELEAQLPATAAQLIDVFDRAAIAYMWTFRSHDAPDQMYELNEGDAWDKAAARLVLAVQQFQARLSQ